MANDDTHSLINRLRNKESQAAREIFDRYVHRLLALVKARISSKLQPRFDAEDIVQSTYRSFFLRTAEGEFRTDESADLWRLLAQIAINKLHRQVEFHSAKKRDVSKGTSDESYAIDIASLAPSSAETVAMVELVQLGLNSLQHNEAIALSKTLAGESVEEIASALGKSQRTIRRLLQHAEQKFVARLQATPDRARCVASTLVDDALLQLRFDDFTLKQLVGRGGMGKVYRAIDKCTGEVVAIKALHKSRQVDARAVESFANEAILIQDFHHPNIVSIRGLGKFPGGGLFLAMQFVDGGDLESRLTAMPLSISAALRFFEQVVSAVAFAHKRGVLHCDLKPANILLTRQNDAVVADFGFARRLGPIDSAKLNSVGGTEGYIAPEIVNGNPPSIAADVYSLGAILRRLVSGQMVALDVDASTRDVARSIKSLAERCASPDPTNRLATASLLESEVASLRSSVEAG